jgi:hypothetical protein
MIGEADRYLHKIAGPFDVVVQDGDAALFAPMLDKLDRLLPHNQISKLVCHATPQTSTTDY